METHKKGIILSLNINHSQSEWRIDSLICLQEINRFWKNALIRFYFVFKCFRSLGLLNQTMTHWRGFVQDRIYFLSDEGKLKLNGDEYNAHGGDPKKLEIEMKSREAEFPFIVDFTGFKVQKYTMDSAPKRIRRPSNLQLHRLKLVWCPAYNRSPCSHWITCRWLLR